MRNRSLPGIVVTLLLIASVAPPAWAQGNQLKIVVGFTAGGITDVFARLFAEEFRKHFGQTVIVENRAGGAGMVAASQVSRAQDDGSTLISWGTSEDGLTTTIPNPTGLVIKTVDW